MNFKNENPTFCIHLDADLKSDQLEALRKSLDSQSIGRWSFCSVDSSEHKAEKNKICTLISAPVTFEPRYFEAILNTIQENQDGIFACNLYVKNRLSHKNLEKYYVPKWSSYRFMGTDYLGPVISLASSLSEKDLNREFLHKLILINKHEPIVLDEFGYVQTGLENLLSNNQRVQILDPSRLLPEKVENFEISPVSLGSRFAKLAPSKISVVIPTRGSSLKGSTESCVVECISSTSQQVLENSQVEFIIVHDVDNDQSYLEKIRALQLNSEIKFIPFNRPFNFSEKCNEGAKHASGDVVVFLNDDIKWISENGLAEIAGLAMQEEVGAVGAKLYFGNGKLQHAGIITAGGNAGHAYFRTNSKIGYFGDLQVTHEVMGVTGACLAQKRTIWETCGQWDEMFANSYNDVDYSFRLRNKDLKVLIANHVELFHFESISRDAFVSDYEFELIRSRWADDLSIDLYMPQVALSEIADTKKSSTKSKRVKQFFAIFKNYGLRTALLRSKRFILKRLNFLSN